MDEGMSDEELEHEFNPDSDLMHALMNDLNEMWEWKRQDIQDEIMFDLVDEIIEEFDGFYDVKSKLASH